MFFAMLKTPFLFEVWVFIFIWLYIWDVYSSECMCMYACWHAKAYGIQKRMLELDPLDLQVFVNHDVGAGNRTWVLPRAADALNCWTICQLLKAFFFFNHVANILMYPFTSVVIMGLYLLLILIQCITWNGLYVEPPLLF